MARVAHFEICADDVERAVSFYRHVFGWEIRRWEGPNDYWVVITGDDDELPGINGGIQDRRDSFAGSVNLIDVPALDNALLRVVEANGTIIHSRTSIPGVGYVAYCRDSEGNAFGLMERDNLAS
jgi:predicted enzyme related to lactoylglutathione lyase